MRTSLHVVLSVLGPSVQSCPFACPPVCRKVIPHATCCHWRVVSLWPRPFACLSVFFLFLLVIFTVVWPACRCMGTVVSWIVCPSLSVGSPVDASIVCVPLSFTSSFMDICIVCVPFIVCESLRVFTLSLMDSCFVCVPLLFVNLLSCSHCHLWTVVLSASLCCLSFS